GHSPSFSIFFFQAEDGIRDRNVTGVQTCALPILLCAYAGRKPTPRAYTKDSPAPSATAHTRWRSCRNVASGTDGDENRNNASDDQQAKRCRKYAPSRFLRHSFP